MLFLILSELCTPLTNWFWNQPLRYTFSIEPFSQKAQLCGGFIRQMGYRPQMAGENNSLQAPVQKLKTDLKHLQCGSKESLEKKSPCYFYSNPPNLLTSKTFFLILHALRALAQFSFHSSLVGASLHRHGIVMALSQNSCRFDPSNQKSPYLRNQYLSILFTIYISSYKTALLNLQTWRKTVQTVDCFV